MRRERITFILLAAVLMAGIAAPAGAATFTTLDDPLGVGGTVVTGVSGNNVVGYYADASGVTHGFEYNGTSFTTIDNPLGGNHASDGTYLQGISGN